MAKLYNLARMTTATTGTGTLTLGSAATVNGVTYLTFANAGVSDGDIVTYAIADTSNSEIGYGTYTASGTTLSRTPIVSTNSNAAISLSGSAQVFITGAAQDFVPRSYLAGLTMSNDGVAPNTKIDITAGQCGDSTFVTSMTLAAGSIDCTTTGANALDTGALGASTWYHAFAISKVTGASAFLASLSPSSPTMPSGYTYLRRIGSFKTDGSSHILPFVQFGNEFLWPAPINDVAATNPGTAAVTRTLTVPTGIVVFAKVYTLVSTDINGDLLLTPLSITDTTPTSAISSLRYQSVAGAAGATQSLIQTNTSSQIRSRLSASDAGVVLDITTYGWWDYRGQFN